MNKKIVLRRMKSVRNTRKITKAMELVSSAKMKRATDATVAARPFALALRSVVSRLVHGAQGAEHPLLALRTRGRVLLVLMQSDRGLCGPYNAQLARLVRQQLAARSMAPDTVDVVAVGKRAAQTARRLGCTVRSLYTDLSAKPSLERCTPLLQEVVRAYEYESYATVLLAYTDFRSVIAQVPNVRTLFPLTRWAEDVGLDAGQVLQPLEPHVGRVAVFEPSRPAVLTRALEQLAASQIYQALLESTASEHSARRLAMQNASEAAADMLGALTLTYNQARQAGITQEIAEISSGKAALE